MNEIINISGVSCYEENGTVYLNLASVAWGLGFTKEEKKNGTTYKTIRWNRVGEYLAEIGFDHKWSKDSYIPENIFYRLAMKAKNETAEKFQALVADEIIPSIRKHGGYIQSTPEMTPEEIMAKAILLANATIENQKKRISELEVKNSELSTTVEISRPKADYFDELVNRNLLTNLRTTAKELNVPQNQFISFLLAKKYLYRDKKGNLLPYSKNNGLFEIKESFNDKSTWKGVQTLVTPKGRETFRLLMIGADRNGKGEN